MLEAEDCVFDFGDRRTDEDAYNEFLAQSFFEF